MPPLNQFPHFSALPLDIRHDIWRRSISGAPIEFLSARRRSNDSGAWFYLEGWGRVSQTHRNSLLSITPSSTDSDNTSPGRSSSRIQITEIASACRDASQAVERVLRTSPTTTNPLYVFDARKAEYTTPNTTPAEPFQTAKQIRSRLRNTNAKAIALTLHWVGRNDQYLEEKLIWGGCLPFSVETVYLVDMSEPVRLSRQEFRQLKLRAGPWYGYQSVFVDLDPNPVETSMAGSCCRVTCMKSAVSWYERDADLLGRPGIQVRMLTRVVLTEGGDWGDVWWGGTGMT